MADKSADTISVIMPCYNGVEYIAASVASALGQTFDEIELVVVNDGSTDCSMQVLEAVRDSRLKTINQLHQGVCAARNQGLTTSTGAYIAFLDADDTWRPDCLEKLYAALQSRPDAMLAYCGWQNLGLEGERGKPFVPPNYEGPDKVESLLGGCPWPIHAALTRRAAIEEAGGLDERFPTSEDYGLWLRIATRHTITRVPEVLAFYHHHEGQQATKNRAQTARNHWLVQREFLRQYPVITEQLGSRLIRELTHGELLRRGYVCYWSRDLEAARVIFRIVMKTGYGTLNDWKYMLPALLPLALHRTLIHLLERKKEGDE